MGIGPLPKSAFTNLAAPASVGQVPVSTGTGRDAVAWAGAPFVPQGIVGLALTWESVTEVRITGGTCRDETDTYNITIALGLYTEIDMSTAGAGGRDTGSEQTDMWYDVYIIDGADVAAAGLFVIMGASPAMPSGYTRRRRVGSVRNSGGDLMGFVQSGGGLSRQYLWLESLGSRIVLSGGAATTPTEVDLSVWAPPIQTERVEVTVTQNLATRPCNILRTVSGATLDVVPGGGTNVLSVAATSGGKIAYENGTGSGTGDVDIYARGYTESLLTWTIL